MARWQSFVVGALVTLLIVGLSVWAGVYWIFAMVVGAFMGFVLVLNNDGCFPWLIAPPIIAVSVALAPLVVFVYTVMTVEGGLDNDGLL